MLSTETPELICSFGSTLWIACAQGGFNATAGRLYEVAGRLSAPVVKLHEVAFQQFTPETWTEVPAPAGVSVVRYLALHPSGYAWVQTAEAVELWRRVVGGWQRLVATPFLAGMFFVYLGGGSIGTRAFSAIHPATYRIEVIDGEVWILPQRGMVSRNVFAPPLPCYRFRSNALISYYLDWYENETPPGQWLRTAPRKVRDYMSCIGGRGLVGAGASDSLPWISRYRGAAAVGGENAFALRQAGSVQRFALPISDELAPFRDYITPRWLGLTMWTQGVSDFLLNGWYLQEAIPVAVEGGGVAYGTVASKVSVLRQNVLAHGTLPSTFSAINGDGATAWALGRPFRYGATEKEYWRISTLPEEPLLYSVRVEHGVTAAIDDEPQLQTVRVEHAFLDEPRLNSVWVEHGSTLEADDEPRLQEVTVHHATNAPTDDEPRLESVYVAHGFSDDPRVNSVWIEHAADLVLPDGTGLIFLNHYDPELAVGAWMSVRRPPADLSKYRCFVLATDEESTETDLSLFQEIPLAQKTFLQAIGPYLRIALAGPIAEDVPPFELVIRREST